VRVSLATGDERAQPKPEMSPTELNTYCASLIATAHVVQWGNSDVWKVGGKVFVIARSSETGALQVTFKVSPMSFDIMKEQAGLRPAPYLASRGMSWIQHYDLPGLNDDDLKLYIQESHRLVASGLSKKRQTELGLI